MPLKQKTPKARIIERFNNLLAKEKYYNRNIFFEDMFTEEELRILQKGRYKFDIVKRNRILLEHTIPPNILRQFYSTNKSAGQLVNKNINPRRDKDFRLIAPDNSVLKEKILFEKKMKKLDTIVGSELKNKSWPECDILILRFDEYCSPKDIKKITGIPKERIDKLIRDMVKRARIIY